MFFIQSRCSRIRLNSWAHIGFTFDTIKRQANIYVDGSSYGTRYTPFSSITNYGVSHYQIGRLTYTNSNNFKGWMKDMDMIDRALNAYEMKVAVCKLNQ